MKRVRISGLKSRPDLNGTVACVLEPLNEAEAQELQSKNRVKVTNFPTPLSLLAANLTPIQEDDPSDARVDWSFVDEPPQGLREVILNTAIGEIDKCHELLKVLLCTLTQKDTPPALPVIKFERSEHILQAIVNNTCTHCVQFLYMNQIGQYVVLETYCGKGRVFQCYVKDASDAGTTGYSAKEWASDKGLLLWQTDLTLAHKRYGGGRELTYDQTVQYVEQLFLLQELASDVSDAFVETFPEELKELERQWVMKLEEGGGGGGDIDLSPITKLTKVFLDGEVPLSILTLYSEDPIEVGGHYRIVSKLTIGGYALDLSIPKGINQPFVRAYQSLFGVTPSVFVYLQLTHHRYWKLYEVRTQANGWALSALTIPH